MNDQQQSRADALTDEQIVDLIYECDIPPDCEPAVMDFARRLLLAASPTSQPAAAPIDEPLWDSKGNVIHEAVDRLGTARAPAPSPACKHCGATTAQACNDKGCFYLESGDGEPAPSPADERAAFEAWWLSDVPEEHRAFAKKQLDGYGPDYVDAPGVADAWTAWRAACTYTCAASATKPVDERAAMLAWAVERWDAEVKNRPLINVHRRSLDDTWRQVIRHLGGDDVSLLGPRHDALLAANPIKPTPAAERFSPAALIVRDCCETDPADPKEPSTICISHETLTEIVERHTTVTACCGRSECGGECGNEWRGRDARAASANETGAEGAQAARTKALRDAIEGECEGLAIDENQAARILMHLDSTSQNGIVPRASSRTEKPVVTPVGWRLMPTSLTLGMRMAMAKSAAEYMRRTGGNSLDVIYEAAISSAPASEGEQK